MVYGEFTLIGTPFTRGGSDETVYQEAHLRGFLTRDAKALCYQKPKVEFCVEYGKKSFMNCVVWGENEWYRFASTMKRGERVIIEGEYVTHLYTTRSGERKERFDFFVDTIYPATRVMELLMASQPDAPPDRFDGTDFDDNDGYDYDGGGNEAPSF